MAEKILYLADVQEDGTLPKVALEVLAGTIALVQEGKAESFTVGLVGAGAKEAANQIAGCGASKFLTASSDEFAHSRYATDALAFAQMASQSQATVVIAPATSRMSRVLPGVSQRLKGALDSRISSWQVADGKLTVSRWYYRQRMMATLTRAARPWFLIVESGIAKAWEGAPGTASSEEISVTVTEEAKRTTVQGIEATSAKASTIRPDADLLFVAGAGWGKKQADGQVYLKEAESIISGFLGNSQASLGSSKSLVDQSGEGGAVLGFMSHLNQVGQTGSSPRHPKGLATCCHGEEPHVVGWRFINERRAVNLDANCGWAQGKADVLYVADAFKVMKKVNELIAAGESVKA